MPCSLRCKRVLSIVLTIVSSTVLWIFMFAGRSDIEFGWTVLILTALFITMSSSCILCMKYIVCGDPPHINRHIEELHNDEEDGLLLDV